MFEPLEHSGLLIWGHEPTPECGRGPCALHNRTNHHMRAFPQHWRHDRQIMERVCPHGVGHPDPDDLRIRMGQDDGIHGCDGCCQRKA